MTIDTAKRSRALRAASIDVNGRRLLVSRFTGTGQEGDLSEPANCYGHGRIRHFRRSTSPGWPDNPLPIDPAASALGLPRPQMMTAQVFQNAACNWRCWYCYVPFDMLAARQELGTWVSAETLVDWILELGDDRPPIVDLSGGQPDLVPEWTAWMARALMDAGLDDSVYLWVDDNLSNDYYWTYLTDTDRHTIASYAAHGRVGCFKGYDEQSFAFNTGAASELWGGQFELIRRHIADGTDCYGYVTFTSPTEADPRDAVAIFVDRLQDVHEYLPLRVVPLEIEVWGPVVGRVRDSHRLALEHQHAVVEAWSAELETRFSSELRARPICDVPLSSR